MAESQEFSVKFWGVRGSIACSGPSTIRYGGNTTCLEIRCGDYRLILDGGTGIRYLGGQLVKGGPVDTDLFLTHTHFDHVCGLPFFVPLFLKSTDIRIWAGHLKPRDLTVRHVLTELMYSPLFPVAPEVFAAKVSYQDFTAGETLRPRPGVTVRTCMLNHPDNATGYRIEFGGKSICFLTDTQHAPGTPDQNILELIAGADLVIYDAMYTEQEFKQRSTWGHSTWQEGVKLCEMAGAKTFVAFHHDPDHDDDFMDRVAEELAAARPGSLVAQEGMVLRP